MILIVPHERWPLQAVTEWRCWDWTSASGRRASQGPRSSSLFTSAADGPIAPQTCCKRDAEEAAEGLPY